MASAGLVGAGGAGPRRTAGQPGPLAGARHVDDVPGGRPLGRDADHARPGGRRRRWWRPLAALPVAWLAVRHRGLLRDGRGAQRLPRQRAARHRGGAGPGHRLDPRRCRALYQTVPLLVLGYASCSCRARSSACARPWSWRRRCSTTWPARSGAPAPAAARRVTLPLVLPGLGASLALVSLAVSTELTATLLLSPIGTSTLATEFWSRASAVAYGAAAPYAARCSSCSRSRRPGCSRAPRTATASAAATPSGRLERPMTGAAGRRAGQVVRRAAGPRRASTSTVTDGITAVLGPSGCGKTTLLRLVAGLPRARRGHDRHRRPGRRRRRPAGARRARRRVGYVPQEGALFPHLDVAANVGLRAARAASRRTARASREVLDLVELPASVAGRYPHELSGGQQQRVALARALAPAPDAGAARRAVLLPRRRAARGHRPRRRAGAAGERRDGGAGHPRPGRGAVAGRPGRGDGRRPVPPGRARRPRSTSRPASPRVAALRRPRHAAAGHGLEAARPPATSARSRVPGDVPATGAARGPARAGQRRPPGAADGVAAEVLDVSYFGHDATLRARVRRPRHRGRSPASRPASVPEPGDGRCACVSPASVLAFPARRRSMTVEQRRSPDDAHPLLGGRPGDVALRRGRPRR